MAATRQKRRPSRFFEEAMLFNDVDLVGRLCAELARTLPGSEFYFALLREMRKALDGIEGVHDLFQEGREVIL